MYCKLNALSFIPPHLCQTETQVVAYAPPASAKAHRRVGAGAMAWHSPDKADQ